MLEKTLSLLRECTDYEHSLTESERDNFLCLFLICSLKSLSSVHCMTGLSRNEAIEKGVIMSDR